jgi:anti-sigma regulatory factor (Ser/Thr protein kinase)
MRGIDLLIIANESAPRAARNALDRLKNEIPPDMLENARLLVSELTTNSVRHAGLPQEATITFRADLSSDRLRVEVVDEGPGFDPEPALPSMYRTEGWGLYLVEQIADRWGVGPGPGSMVWFELDRPAAEATG